MMSIHLFLAQKLCVLMLGEVFSSHTVSPVLVFSPLTVSPCSDSQMLKYAYAELEESRGAIQVNNR